MGRKTIAAKIIDDLVEFKGAEGHFLIVYEFASKIGETTHQNFFTNLHRIMEELGDGLRVQRSIIECKHELTTKAISDLCTYYGARDITIYEVKNAVYISLTVANQKCDNNE